MAAAGAAVPEPALAPKKFLISGISVPSHATTHHLELMLMAEFGDVAVERTEVAGAGWKARGDATIAWTRAAGLVVSNPRD